VIVFFGTLQQMKDYIRENKLHPKSVIHWRSPQTLIGRTGHVKVEAAADFKIPLGDEYSHVIRRIAIQNAIYPEETS
jgi:hypothetical protein